AVPLVYVLEAVRRSRSEINTLEGDKEVIRLRGNVVPLLRLGSVMSRNDENSDYQPLTSMTADGISEEDQIWVVIVRIGEKLVGFAVDELTELQEIVVKSLGKYIGDVKGIAGASVLGDGRIVLILDVMTLIYVALQRNLTTSAVG
ncbi:MAG: chemotaxis protein CheW, partial [Chloroflexi bacterium]|nr:chemotaxis protein CheW [Chloroflexota bacterium]